MDLKAWYSGGCFSGSAVERKLGIPNGSIGHWLSGRRSLSAENLGKLESWAMGYGYERFPAIPNAEEVKEQKSNREEHLIQMIKEDEEAGLYDSGAIEGPTLPDAEVWDYTNPFWREEMGFEDSFKAIGLWKWGLWEGGAVLNVEGVVMYKEGVGSGSVVDLGSIKVKLEGLKNKVILL